MKRVPVLLFPYSCFQRHIERVVCGSPGLWEGNLKSSVNDSATLVRTMADPQHFTFCSTAKNHFATAKDNKIALKIIMLSASVLM